MSEGSGCPTLFGLVDLQRDCETKARFDSESGMINTCRTVSGSELISYNVPWYFYIHDGVFMTSSSFLQKGDSVSSVRHYIHGVCMYVSVCIGVYRCVSVCVGVCRCVSVCVCWCVLRCGTVAKERPTTTDKMENANDNDRQDGKRERQRTTATIFFFTDTSLKNQQL